MKVQTYHTKLVASYTDTLGYISYVFEDLEYQDIDYKYIMCIRFPNWEQNEFNINDVGFVTVRYVQEGIDTWFNGKEFTPYKFTNIIFCKFIHEKDKFIPSEIILD